MTSKKTISILGCGWYGLPLATELIKNNYVVKGSTTTPMKIDTLKKNSIVPFLLDSNKLDAADDRFWDADRLIITVPPTGAPSDFQKNTESLANMLSKKYYEQVIVISSSSVYPDKNKTVNEEDASYETKSRSGVSLLEYEDTLFAPNTCIIRFGGLFGPNRHPVTFLSGRQLTGGASPVNLIHISDCIAISYSIVEKEIVNSRLNACHPDHPTKAEYYGSAAKILGITPPDFSTEPAPYKQISSEKLIQKINYSFSEKLQLI